MGRRERLQVACLLMCVVALPCRAQSYTEDEWKRQIVARLQSHGQFPREACSKGGEATVAFTLDRAGKLMSSTIVSGTGVAAMDDAALKTIQSAQPFPPAPPGLADDDLKFKTVMVFVKPASTASCDLSSEDRWRASEERLRRVTRSICRGC